MLNTDKILKELCVTEKANELSSNQNKYVFEIYPKVNQIEVAKAVEKTFDVKVLKVNVLNRKGKRKRNRQNHNKMGQRASSKRAIVTLAEGDKIEMI